jgi:hypothetical protein
VVAHVNRIGGVACRVASAAVGGAVSDHAFHHLTPGLLGNVINIANQMQWGGACMTVNVSAGHFYQVFGAGVGSVDISELILGPFVG